MVQDYKEKEKSVTYIKPYFNTIQLGRTIASNGCIPVLALLFENPKLYTEILVETEIPGTTLNRALKLLLSISLIKKDRTISKGRETHFYSISQVGKELIKFINVLERTLSLEPNQMTFEINKIGNIHNSH